MTINGGVRTREPVRRAEGSRVPASLIEVIDAIPYNGALMTERGVVTSFNSDEMRMQAMPWRVSDWSSW